MEPKQNKPYESSEPEQQFLQAFLGYSLLHMAPSVTEITKTVIRVEKPSNLLLECLEAKSLFLFC